MFSFGTPELIYLHKPASPINNDKKVYFLAIAEDFLGKISTNPVYRLEVIDRYSQPRGPCLALRRVLVVSTEGNCQHVV